MDPKDFTAERYHDSLASLASLADGLRGMADRCEATGKRGLGGDGMLGSYTAAAAETMTALQNGFANLPLALLMRAAGDADAATARA